MNELNQIKFDNQLILTTEQLADFYGTTTKAIAQNFKNNEDKFEEGKHYYLLKGAQLKDFKSQFENFELPINKFASQLYLWTKRGASRHAKMLGTDRAWDVYDELEETYFNPQRLPQTPEEKLALTMQVANRLDTRVTKVEADIDFLKNKSEIDSLQRYQFDKARKRTAIRVCGGKDSNFYQTKGAPQKVFRELARDFKDVFKISRYDDLKKEDFEDAINFVNGWHASFVLEKEIEQINAQTNLDI